MTYASVADRDAIEAESTWEDRPMPVTLHQMLEKTATTHASRNALTYQLLSDPKAKAETLSWTQLLEKTNQTANLFHELGVGENDVVAFLLPNATETAGSSIRSTRCWTPIRSRQSCVKPVPRCW